MARNQKNFQNFLYIDDDGISWTKRGEDGGAGAAVDGHAAQTGAPMWVNGSRYHARTITYQDPVTFRTVDPVFYTAAAFAAVANGDILAVQVAGLATTVNYSAIGKNAERKPKIRTARELPDT